MHNGFEKEHDPVPGLAGDVRYDEFENLRPDDGAFVAEWNGPTTGLGIKAGVWAGPATNLQLVARDGQPAPGSGGHDFKSLQTELEEARRPGEPWAALGTASNAADQSGLPEGVVRREATVTTDAQSAFYRISVRVLPPPQ